MTTITPTRWLSILMAGLVAASASGCSTMSTIRSEPPGAKLYLNNKYVGETPVNIELEDGFWEDANYKARFEYPGYVDKKITLPQDWNWAMLFVEGFLLGSFVFTLPIGLGLCSVNCKAHRATYNYDLAPAGSIPAPAMATPPAAPVRPRGNQRISATSGIGDLSGTKIAVIPTQLDPSAAGQVPDLFDDYLLTAVQNAGDFQVIGQEDISALLGFEQQKDLLDCSDTSCMADIGGALGVDRIVVAKVARLDKDWVVTAKIVNIKEAKVESRINEIIHGSVKDLLMAVTKLIRALFGVPQT